MGLKYNRVQCNGNCTTTQRRYQPRNAIITHRARYIFRRARRRPKGGKLVLSLEGSGGRGASCISRELGCNNYYLSHFLAHSPSCAHHYISSHHSTSVGWNATAVVAVAAAAAAVLRKSNWFPEFIARQIFPLSSRLHGRIARAMVHRYRPGVYARVQRTYAPAEYAGLRRPRINFLRIINQRAGHDGVRSAPRVRKQQREASRGRIREFFSGFRADRPAGTLTISTKKAAGYLFPKLCLNYW